MVGKVGSFEGVEIELWGMELYLQSVNIRGDFDKKVKFEGIL